MTTKEAEAAYLAKHPSKMAGRGYAIYNPHDRQVSELPVIYGFNNGGSPGWMSAILLAEDGEPLGGHVCSSEGYMPHDLGVLTGSRPDRHETFRAKYPEGYRMEFVSYSEVDGHAGLNAAVKKHEARTGEQAGAA